MEPAISVQTFLGAGGVAAGAVGQVAHPFMFVAHARVAVAFGAGVAQQTARMTGSAPAVGSLAVERRDSSLHRRVKLSRPAPTPAGATQPADDQVRNSLVIKP